MSGNALVNAGFVDGTTGWGGSAGQVITVDESARGFEGRLVLKGTKVVANAEVLNLSVPAAQYVAVTAGQTLEVFAHHAFTLGASSLAVNFYDNALDAKGNLDVPVVKVGDGNPRLGLSSSFSFSHARLIVPVGATKARVFLSATATSAGAADLLLMKPYLESLPSAKTKYRCWDPGVAINDDLGLPRWPTELPHLRADSFSVEPIPTRRGFSTDSGVEISQKLVNVPWYRVRGSFRVDQETQAILDKFFRDVEDFWFVRPDTLQLCQATWLADGDPVYSGLGSDRMVSFGLQIRVI